MANKYISEKRKELIDFINEQIVGPGSYLGRYGIDGYTKGEVIDTTPGNVYCSAILFPKKDSSLRDASASTVSATPAPADDAVPMDQDADGNEIVAITEQGKHIADTLNGKLLSSVREKALKSALRLLSFKKRGTKITREVSQLPHGKYEFKCEIKDNSGDLMELRVTLDNPKQLDRTVYNFDARPEFIYKGILALLAGEANYLLD